GGSASSVSACSFLSRRHLGCDRIASPLPLGAARPRPPHAPKHFSPTCRAFVTEGLLLQPAMRTPTACACAALLLVARPAAAEPMASDPPPPAPAAPTTGSGGGLLDHLKIQAYVQAQFLTQHVNEAASPNLVDGQLPEGVGPNDVVARPNGT